MYPGAPEIYPKNPVFGRPKIVKNLTFRLSDPTSGPGIGTGMVRATLAGKMLDSGLERPWRAQTRVHAHVGFDDTGARKAGGDQAVQGPMCVITQPGQ